MIDNDELLIKEHDSETLYKNSMLRTNILGWYDFKAGAKTLVVGEECPIVLEFLKSLNLFVTYADCFDETVLLEQFAYVILLGEADRASLKKAKAALEIDGVLFVAVANSDGLMYKAGIRAEEKSQNRVQLTEHVKAAGFEKVKWYYPFPEYKLATELYSDDYLPSEGSVSAPWPSYDGDYIIKRNAIEDFDLCVREGQFPEVCNSYLLVCQRSELLNNPVDEMLYAKFNSLRAPGYRLATGIYVDASGERYVKKWALSDAAKAFLSRIVENGHKLEENFNMLTMAKAEYDGNAVRFEYIKGKSLWAGQDIRTLGLKELILAIEINLMTIFSTEADNIGIFEVTDGFEEIFGDYTPNSLVGKSSLKVSNPDSIFSNFLVAGAIYCLDYEWYFDFPVPEKYLHYRTITYFYRENEKLMPVDCEEKLLAEYGFSEMEIVDCKALELAFQLKVQGYDLRYNYLPHYRWRAWTKKEWRHEHSIPFKVKRKLGI